MRKEYELVTKHIIWNFDNVDAGYINMKNPEDNKLMGQVVIHSKNILIDYPVTPIHIFKEIATHIDEALVTADKIRKNVL